MVIIPSFVVDTALLLLSSTLLRFPIGFLIRKDQTSHDGCVWHRLSPSPPPPIPEDVRSPQEGALPYTLLPSQHSLLQCSVLVFFFGGGAAMTRALLSHWSVSSAKGGAMTVGPHARMEWGPKHCRKGKGGCSVFVYSLCIKMA